MIHLKDPTKFGRPVKRAGNPDPLQKTEERVVTSGWLCMTATLLVALLLAAYAAI